MIYCPHGNKPRRTHRISKEATVRSAGASARVGRSSGSILHHSISGRDRIRSTRSAVVPERQRLAHDRKAPRVVSSVVDPVSDLRRVLALRAIANASPAGTTNAKAWSGRKRRRSDRRNNRSIRRIVPPRIPGRRGPFRDSSPCGPDLRIVSIAACAPSVGVVQCAAFFGTHVPVCRHSPSAGRFLLFDVPGTIREICLSAFMLAPSPSASRPFHTISLQARLTRPCARCAWRPRPSCPRPRTGQGWSRRPGYATG